MGCGPCRGYCSPVIFTTALSTRKLVLWGKILGLPGDFIKKKLECIQLAHTRTPTSVGIQDILLPFRYGHAEWYPEAEFQYDALEGRWRYPRFQVLLSCQSSMRTTMIVSRPWIFVRYLPGCSALIKRVSMLVAEQGPYPARATRTDHEGYLYHRQMPAGCHVRHRTRSMMSSKSRGFPSSLDPITVTERKGRMKGRDR